MVLLGDEAQLENHRLTFYLERTIGSKIILDALDGTPW
jgi:hypothetical protein